MAKKPSIKSTHKVSPTIHDVAQAAGVSIATVSNVVNSHPTAVGEVTRQRVLQYIEQLGYRPHSVGRGLRTRRRQLVAMLMVDEAENYVIDPFVANLVAGFSEAVNARGYATVVRGCRAQDLDATVVVKTLGVDGYCLSLSGSDEVRSGLLHRLQGLNQPLVLAQDTLQQKKSDVCIVRQDDFSGGLQLADHLLARGAKRLALLTTHTQWPAFNARVAGFMAGVKRAGQKLQPQVLQARSERFADACGAVKEHLVSGIKLDAIVGCNDQLAIAALQAVKACGLQVPRDIMITGFNALETWQYCSPNLTTVRSQPRELGILAGNSLIDRLDSGVFAQREIVLPVSLQPGHSTER